MKHRISDLNLENYSEYWKSNMESFSYYCACIICANSIQFKNYLDGRVK